MNTAYNIEQSIIASVLNSEIEHNLNPHYFSSEFHRKLVTGINRLKELDECIDFELLRNKFVKHNRWTYKEDAELSMIMTHTTPFATQKMFDAYYSLLETEYRYSIDRRMAI